jgi:predicted phosphodiesterase
MTFRIGIVSDTHGLLRPEAERRVAGVDHIVHGDDIGNPDIVPALRRIAPVTAIRGNVDTGDWPMSTPRLSSFGWPIRLRLARSQRSCGSIPPQAASMS